MRARTGLAALQVPLQALVQGFTQGIAGPTGLITQFYFFKLRAEHLDQLPACCIDIGKQLVPLLVNAFSERHNLFIEASYDVNLPAFQCCVSLSQGPAISTPVQQVFRFHVEHTPVQEPATTLWRTRNK